MFHCMVDVRVLIEHFPVAPMPMPDSVIQASNERWRRMYAHISYAAWVPMGASLPAFSSREEPPYATIYDLGLLA